MITRFATKNDIQGILDLQDINFFDKLLKSEKENGFVTTPFTPSQLEGLLSDRGLFVLEAEDIIQGYTVAASWNYFSQWPIFPLMISQMSGKIFEGIKISPRNTFQYGPSMYRYPLTRNQCPSLFI